MPRCVGAQGAQGAGAAPALSLLCYIALECTASETLTLKIVPELPGVYSVAIFPRGLLDKPTPTPGSRCPRDLTTTNSRQMEKNRCIMHADI